MEETYSRSRTDILSVIRRYAPKRGFQSTVQTLRMLEMEPTNNPREILQWLAAILSRGLKEDIWPM